MNSIEQKYTALGGAQGFLGAPTGPETATPDGEGRCREYQGGVIYWHPHQGAFEVHGAILARYKALGGPAGFLGFPHSDEEKGAQRGSKVSRFEGGHIYWSAKTGAHEVHGEILIRYLYHGAEGGSLGLPTSDEVEVPGGRKSEFQRATIYWSSSSGAHEVHGAIRTRYHQLGGPGSFLGFPTSDESDILQSNGKPSGGKVSRFQGGTIYWSKNSNAYEVHGTIRALYESKLGGPLGPLGYPLTNEKRLAQPDIRYNNFQKGIIVWRSGKGARAITELELYLGMVKAGKIDDGITWFAKDRSAELITYTTVEANGQTLESNKRRPGDHAGDSYDLNARYLIKPIQANTKIRFTIRVKDWDQASSDDYLASLEKTFDIRTCWGLDSGNEGAYLNQPATHKGKDAPSHNSVTFDYRVSRPGRVDKTRPFRQEAWWQFDNFKTPKLSRQLYANTFRDVEVTGSTWEEILNPFDSLYYELAFDEMAANGNCFGMAVEALHALMGRSVFAEPIYRYNDTAGLRQVINMKHGYQLGAEHIRWAINRLTRLDAVKPLNTFRRVRDQLRLGDPVIVSMFSIKDFKGHSVLAYQYQEGGNGKPHRIFVADPNLPWGEAPKQTHPSYIDIYTNNTFKFVTNGQTRYQSSKIVGNRLPGTVMYDTPFHVVSGAPRTPFWEILQDLVNVVGGLIILAGDAQTEQLQANGANFYTGTESGREIKPNAIPQLARIPFLNYGGQVPELYARRGSLPNDLGLTVQGQAPAGAPPDHERNLRLGIRTARNTVVVEGPIAESKRDKIELTETYSAHPLLTAATEEEAKAVKVNYAICGNRPGHSGWGIETELGVAREAKARLCAEPNNLGCIIENAGPERPCHLKLVTFENGQPNQSIISLPPEARRGVVRLRPEDLVSPHGNVVVERLSSIGGKVIEQFVERFQPMP